MQKMIEQAGSSRQLFETVNFAFIKNFDFLVKIVIFWAFLLFLWEILVMHICPGSSVRVWPYMAVMLDGNLLNKRRNVLKRLFRLKKSKIFIKAKLTASKSCPLGLVYFMICCILRDAILLSLDFLKFRSLEF